MFSLQAIAEKQATEAEARKHALKVGVWLSEICELFKVSRQHARTIFEAARILEGRPSREGIYSRGAIVELLSEWNSRSIGFPKEPWLTTQEASTYLSHFGVHAPVGSLGWWRLHAPERGPLFIRIGQLVVRYTIADLDDYADSLSGDADDDG